MFPISDQPSATSSRRQKGMEPAGRRITSSISSLCFATTAKNSRSLIAAWNAALSALIRSAGTFGGATIGRLGIIERGEAPATRHVHRDRFRVPRQVADHVSRQQTHIQVVVAARRRTDDETQLLAFVEVFDRVANDGVAQSAAKAKAIEALQRIGASSDQFISFGSDCGKRFRGQSLIQENFDLRRKC